MCGGDAALLSDYFEHMLFVVAAAYSQLFCGVVSSATSVMLTSLDEYFSTTFSG